MLPKIVHESQVQIFKFWFNDGLQDGIHYQNNLYYRLSGYEGFSRAKLCQVGAKLSQQGADVLLTLADQQCSLWANLRNQKVAAIAFSSHVKLPAVDTLIAGPVLTGSQPPTES